MRNDLNLLSCSHCCRRERSKVPYIVRQCLEEIERRGLEEVGIYRVSGVATDIQALKTAFDTSECRLLWEERVKRTVLTVTEQ